MKSNSRALLNLAKSPNSKKLRQHIQTTEAQDQEDLAMSGKYWGVRSKRERDWIDKHMQSSKKENPGSPA